MTTVKLTEQNLLVDIGSTLIKINEAFEVYTARAAQYVSEEMGGEQVGANAKKLHQFRDAFRKEAHRTLIERNAKDFLKEGIKNIWGVSLDQDRIKELEQVYIRSEVSITTRFDDAISFLKRAKEAGKRVIIATNNFSELQIDEVLTRFEIKPFVDDCFISGLMLARKPNKKFFDIILSECDIASNSSVIIGDTLTQDIEGGINGGIRTCWLNRYSKLNDTSFRPTYEVSSLDNLLF
ncbi:MAG: HAD family hydrolase [Flavobacteriales bacterium]|nr:HAD family hydrolase [Flavobacteriales bacterium]